MSKAHEHFNYSVISINRISRKKINFISDVTSLEIFKNHLSYSVQNIVCETTWKFQKFVKIYNFYTKIKTSLTQKGTSLTNFPHSIHLVRFIGHWLYSN